MYLVSKNKKKAAGEVKTFILVAFFFAILLIPNLFGIYRINAFNTIPRDPYEPYLLYLAGNDLGFLPGSPFVYRVFSILPALIPYYLFPAPVYTLLQDVNPYWLRAIFANALLS